MDSTGGFIVFILTGLTLILSFMVISLVMDTEVSPEYAECVINYQKMKMEEILKLCGGR